MTEITDNIGRGAVLYDGGCGACSKLANLFRGGLQGRRFRLLSLHDPEAATLSGASVDAMMRELHVVAPETGNADRLVVLRGVDALLYVAAAFAWMRPLCALARLPGANQLLRAAYRAFAANRYRISRAGTCSIRRGRGNGIAWTLPVVLAAIVVLTSSALPPWAWMWTLAWALFFTFKWITWWPWRGRASVAMSAGYLLAWPGMDAATFFGPRTAVAPTRRQWLAAILKTIAGVSSIWLVARLLSNAWPIARGWCVMFGIAATLHFGLLDLISLAWRRAGVVAEPLMLAPSRSRSLAEFWGRRWNTGFRTLSHDLMFAPLRRRIGAVGATVATFFASGVIHDLVISLPARGGYGLPTLYFLIQCCGLLFERSKLARRAGLGCGFGGWLYTALVTLAPLPLLFHGPFVHRVILPFFNAITHTPEVHMNSVRTLELLLIIGGVLHLCITSAGLAMTIVLDWRRSLSSLCGLTRHIIWTHGGFVLLTIVGFGAISLLAPSSLASGAPLARAVCGFIALFWAIRLLIQFFVFDARPYLTNRLLAVGYHGLTVVFSYFVLAYGLCAVH